MAYRIGTELDMREKRQMNGGDHESIMIHFRHRHVRYIRQQARSRGSASISNAGGCKHRERRRLRLQRPEGHETNGEVGKCNVTYN